MKKYILLISFILIAGCSRNEADVGSISISARDIDFRAKVSEIYYPGSGKPYVGLSQLIKGYLSFEILRSLGHKIDDAVIAGEAKRIDESTKAPEMLAKIKAVYGNDRKAYLDTFVRLVYAERVLYGEVFLKSHEIQKEQRQQAEELLRSGVAAPTSFASHAKQKGFPVSILKISREKGIAPYARPTGMPAQSGGEVGMEQAERIIPLLSGLKPGRICPEIIEWQEAFQVIRFLRREGKNYIVESASIPKKRYDDWFWEKAAAIPVAVSDQQLRAEFIRQVSWAGKLNLR